jgi:MFS family permease
MIAESRRVFHGWWIVLVAAVGMFLCYISVVSFTFGVFIGPLRKEFNWSLTELSLASSLSLVAMCLAMPVMGPLVDRLGARRVIIPSVLIFGLCLVSFYFLTGSLLHFYTAFIVLGIAGGGSSNMPYSNVISHWFDRKRGLAIALASSGAGLGSFVFPPVAQSLIAAAGWRVAYLILGLVVIVVTVPVVGIFLKEKPQMMSLLPDGAHAPQRESEAGADHPTGMSGSEGLRSNTFWIICTSFFFITSGVIGCLIHLVPMLTGRGVSEEQAALSVAVLGGASLIGGIIAGWMLDRVMASTVSVVFFGGAGVGMLILWSGATDLMAIVAAFLVGLGMGAAGQIQPYLISRYFGLRAFGELYSYALISFTLGGVVGPLLMGIGFDAMKSYRFVLGLFVVAALAATVMMTRLGPYRTWERSDAGAAASLTQAG